jgi:hypothetical protein
VDSAMSGILGKLDAGFDPAAGLADIYARSGAGQDARPPADVPAAPVLPPGTTAGSSRLAEVCDQIDRIGAQLSDVIRSAGEAPFGGCSFLELARDALVQLRTGLSARSLSRPEAERLASQVQGEVSRADQVLRSRHACTLEDIIRARTSQPGWPGGTLAGEMTAMREMILRLYAAEGHHSPLVPAR